MDHPDPLRETATDRLLAAAERDFAAAGDVLERDPSDFDVITAVTDMRKELDEARLSPSLEVHFGERFRFLARHVRGWQLVAVLVAVGGIVVLAVARGWF